MDRTEFIKRTLIFACIVALAYILVVTRQLVLVSLIGVALAIIITPAVDWLKTKFKIPRPAGTILIFFIILTLISGIFILLGDLSAEQVQSLSKDFPDFIEKIEKVSHKRIGSFGSINTILRDINIQDSLSKLFDKAAKMLTLGFAGVAGALISLVISFFLCITSDFYTKQLPLLVIKEKRPEFKKIMATIAATLRTYSQALLLDMTVVALITTLGLYLISFKYWLVMGIVTGLFNIVPYVGIIVVTLLATLICLAEDPNQLPLILLVYLITQQLEGNIILPLIMRQKASLPEVPLLIFILIMGQIFGVLGAIVSAPLLAVSIELINWKREKGEYILKT